MLTAYVLGALLDADVDRNGYYLAVLKARDYLERNVSFLWLESQLHLHSLKRFNKCTNNTQLSYRLFFRLQK